MSQDIGHRANLFGFALLAFSGLVVAAGVEGEFADDVADCGVADGDVQ
jgi:hypothetical protein